MNHRSNKLMLGGNIFGHFTDRQETERVIHRAQELQVLAIDTADTYSDGLSEQIIGECIKNNRKSWFIASKVGIRSHAFPGGLGSKVSIMRKIEGSLRRLQTDYLDLYQMHVFDPMTPLQETIETFNQLIQQGKILSAGISNFDLNHLGQLKGILPHCITFHQLAFNITNAQMTREILDACIAQKIDIIAYATLARGLLSERYSDGMIPDDSRAATSQSIQADLTPHFLQKLKQTEILAKAYHSSLSQIALQWVNKCKAVKRLIVGCKNISQLESAYQALNIELPDQCLREAEHLWSPP